MRTLAARMRSLALVLALLPGLLLAEGEHLTVCLHALVGLSDACVAAEAGSSVPDCCAPTAGGPSVSSQGGCSCCCIALAGQATERPAPAPAQASGLAVALSLPPSVACCTWMLAVTPALLRPDTPDADPAPGRAPTPLRI